MTRALSLALFLTAGTLAAQSIADPQVTEIRPLTINTPDLEYAPTITADGQTLYFCSDRAMGHGGHDIWMSTRNGDDPAAFAVPMNIGSQVNTPLNEGVASIAADGRTIYFTGCQRDDGYGDCDIYVAELVNGVFAGVRNIGPVNTPYWDTQPTVSADGRTLYFVSNRPGALGGSGDADIWVTTKQGDGSWGPARNLGPEVNTLRREDSPYLHPGGELLYFSSAGRGGVGGMDFFVTRRIGDILSDTGDVWSEPVNLGAPINTSRDERFITVPEDGGAIYFSSDRTDLGGAGKLDIYVATGLSLPNGSPVTGASTRSSRIIVTPTPASDRITITLEGDAAAGAHTLSISDASGRAHLQSSFDGASTTVLVEGLPSGLYLVRVDGLAATIVVQH